MDISTISGAYTAIKIAKDVFSSLLNSKIEEKSKEKINEALLKLGNVQDTLFELREELFKLQSERDSLKKELEQRDNWDKKISEYKLIKAPGGGMTYSFQGEPNHYICPRCVSKHEIQILQDEQNIYTGSFLCPSCNNRYKINVAHKTPESDPPRYY